MVRSSRSERAAFASRLPPPVVLDIPDRLAPGACVGGDGTVVLVVRVRFEDDGWYSSRTCALLFSFGAIACAKLGCTPGRKASCCWGPVECETLDSGSVDEEKLERVPLDGMELGCVPFEWVRLVCEKLDREVSVGCDVPEAAEGRYSCDPENWLILCCPGWCPPPYGGSYGAVWFAE